MSSSRTMYLSVCRIRQSRSMAVVASLLEYIRTWTLDVADDGTGGVVHELNTDLGNTSTGTCKMSELRPDLCFCACAERYFVICIPVRPKTRVTLTSLTGTLLVSILANL